MIIYTGKWLTMRVFVVFMFFCLFCTFNKIFTHSKFLRQCADKTRS